MASKSIVIRPAQRIAQGTRPVCRLTSSITLYDTIRQLSLSGSRPQDGLAETNERPRWSHTPERMKMPYRVRLVDPEKKWECNSDPKRLDHFYIKLLGVGGDKMLPEEVKWLAVTHKSFEQGARGFNDRLAFLGRRLINLQTDLALVSSEPPEKSSNSMCTPDGRTPFEHPSLVGLPNLVNLPRSDVLTVEKIASLATSMGMRNVVRWHPRLIRDLDASGINAILTTSIYAIFGALALQNGGKVAINLAKARVLKPLGIV
ncbi:RNase III domain-containing protein [Blumeria hordei DH14]|uniref:RNase III domain-containing protein n=1 Tax=Blumeria graminis f. sp. hordei (strain DH14) TaxID=546991 RepID=N1JBT5_BLUG1|nr:RNase III domain-containing protein [Blumeria hordei DH14]